MRMIITYITIIITVLI